MCPIYLGNTSWKFWLTCVYVHVGRDFRNEIWLWNRIFWVGLRKVRWKAKGVFTGRANTNIAQTFTVIYRASLPGALSWRMCKSGRGALTRRGGGACPGDYGTFSLSITQQDVDFVRKDMNFSLGLRDVGFCWAFYGRHCVQWHSKHTHSTHSLPPLSTPSPPSSKNLKRSR